MIKIDYDKLPPSPSGWENDYSDEGLKDEIEHIEQNLHLFANLDELMANGKRLEALRDIYVAKRMLS